MCTAIGWSVLVIAASDRREKGPCEAYASVVVVEERTNEKVCRQDARAQPLDAGHHFRCLPVLTPERPSQPSLQDLHASHSPPVMTVPIVWHRPPPRFRPWSIVNAPTPRLLSTEHHPPRGLTFSTPKSRLSSIPTRLTWHIYALKSLQGHHAPLTFLSFLNLPLRAMSDHAVSLNALARTLLLEAGSIRGQLDYRVPYLYSLLQFPNLMAHLSRLSESHVR